MSLGPLALALLAQYVPVEGVPVHCSASTGAASGRVEVVIAAGALSEPEDAEGVAHLLEHVILRPFGLDDENGATEWDATRYWTRAAPTRLATAAVDLVEAIRAPKLDPEAVRLEALIVARELEDRGSGRASTDRRFHGTRFDRPLGGTTSGVTALRPEALAAFHAAHYSAANLAVIATDAADCEALIAALGPSLARLPRGVPSPRPVERAVPRGPVHLGDSPDRFIGGFFWFEASLAEELVWRIVAHHLERRAFEELRTAQGLTYSPQASVARLGGAGTASLEVRSSDPARVARWYDDTIAGLLAEPRPAERLRASIAAVRAELSPRNPRSALAALRGEPSPTELLDALDDARLSAALTAQLVPALAFGTARPTIGRFVLLGLAGVVVLGFLAALGLKLARGET
jgi:predicted Zn-dependent peptidase